MIVTIACRQLASNWYDLPMDETRWPRREAAHEVTVDGSVSGQRIDNFLTTYLKGVPRTRIYRLLRRGEVRVNRGRVRQHYRLAPGDVVRVPPVRMVEIRPRKTPSEARLCAIEQAILYEDDGLIVLNKPSGMGGAWWQRARLRGHRVFARRPDACPSTRSGSPTRPRYVRMSAGLKTPQCTFATA